MAKPLHILLLDPIGGGVGYFRSRLPGMALERLGHTITYLPLHSKSPNDVMGFLEGLGDGVDVVHMLYCSEVVWVNMIYGAYRNWLLTKHGKEVPVITDLDDDIHAVPTYNIAYRSYTQHNLGHKTVVMQLRVSDAVTTTNERVRTSIGKDCKHIYTLPNYCDVGRWEGGPSPDRASDHSVRVMYAGGPAHYGDVKEIEEPITRLIDRYDGTKGKPLMRMVWMGITPDWSEGWIKHRTDPSANRAFQVQLVEPPTYHRVLRFIAPDVMIAPLVDNTFNHAKTCIKAYDAACGGAAFVCSDLPPYAGVPNEAAVKCSTVVQWEESLAWLIEDGEARRRKAASLSSWVAGRGIDQYIHLWEGVYRECMARPVVKSLEDVVQGHTRPTPVIASIPEGTVVTPSEYDSA